MNTISQVFYKKLMGAPEGWYDSQEGRKTIAKIARMIRAKEGRESCMEFLQKLLVVSIVRP